MNGLKVSPSPHVHDNISTQKVMLNVIIGLLPACIAGVIIFGYMAAVNLIVCVVSCVVFEYLSRKIMKRTQTISDLSAVVTGLLLGMNLPAAINPLIGVVGSFVAIVVVKQLFGGIGQNFANPAIVGRIVLMLSFTSQMSEWCLPFYYRNSADVVTGATPLVSGDASYLDLFLGNVGGCLGETSALALLIGGLYLVVTRTISLHAPLAFIGTAALLTLVTGGDVGYQVLSGGLILGAFFMATDYVTSPITPKGQIVFGILLGVLTGIFRIFGASAEGVSYAIIISNLMVPLIEKVTIPVPFGKEGIKDGK